MIHPLEHIPVNVRVQGKKVTCLDDVHRILRTCKSLVEGLSSRWNQFLDERRSPLKVGAEEVPCST